IIKKPFRVVQARRRKGLDLRNTRFVLIDRLKLVLMDGLLLQVDNKKTLPRRSGPTEERVGFAKHKVCAN
ncbi:hypothetical protein, partial [Escherichia coli]|uniref:hypothetical protein n=1 Tax=Escherichia coli TaxID=562 RepID=UPI00197A9204